MKFAFGWERAGIAWKNSLRDSCRAESPQLFYFILFFFFHFFLSWHLTRITVSTERIAGTMFEICDIVAAIAIARSICHIVIISMLFSKVYRSARRLKFQCVIKGVIFSREGLNIYIYIYKNVKIILDAMDVRLWSRTDDCRRIRRPLGTFMSLAFPHRLSPDCPTFWVNFTVFSFFFFFCFLLFPLPVFVFSSEKSRAFPWLPRV